MRRRFFITAVLTLSIVFVVAPFRPAVLWILLLVGPLVVLGFADMVQTKHTLWRNFPVIGHGRWLMEHLRPMIRQYFIESDIDGAPVNRVFRSVVYQRAKREMDTVVYGTKFDVYRVGYEWIGHSWAARDPGEVHPDLRVTIGGPDCKQNADRCRNKRQGARLIRKEK